MLIDCGSTNGTWIIEEDEPRCLLHHEAAVLQPGAKLQLVLAPGEFGQQDALYIEIDKRQSGDITVNKVDWKEPDSDGWFLRRMCAYLELKFRCESIRAFRLSTDAPDPTLKDLNQYPMDVPGIEGSRIIAFHTGTLPDDDVHNLETCLSTNVDRRKGAKAEDLEEKPIVVVSHDHRQGLKISQDKYVRLKRAAEAEGFDLMIDLVGEGSCMIRDGAEQTDVEMQRGTLLAFAAIALEGVLPATLERIRALTGKEDHYESLGKQITKGISALNKSWFKNVPKGERHRGLGEEKDRRYQFCPEEDKQFYIFFARDEIGENE
jgi:hypothetical protein